MTAGRRQRINYFYGYEYRVIILTGYRIHFINYYDVLFVVGSFSSRVHTNW